MKRRVELPDDVIAHISLFLDRVTFCALTCCSLKMRSKVLQFKSMRVTAAEMVRCQEEEERRLALRAARIRAERDNISLIKVLFELETTLRQPEYSSYLITLIPDGNEENICARLRTLGYRAKKYQKDVINIEWG